MWLVVIAASLAAIQPPPACKLGKRTIRCNPASFGPLHATLRQIQVVAASPVHGCDAQQAEKYAGVVIAIERGGGCSFSKKVQVAEAAGAAGVIIIDSQRGETKLLKMIQLERERAAFVPSIPTVAITHADGLQILGSNSL